MALSFFYIDFNKLILDLTKDLKIDSIAKGVYLKTKLPNYPLILNLPVNRLKTAIGNIISNSIDFTPMNGRVLVKVSASYESIQIAIKDTGCGIQPDDLVHIFENKFTTRKSNSLLNAGEGFGLYYAKEVVENLGGKILVISKVDKGTTFKVSIPI